jgi:hypothetical protein
MNKKNNPKYQHKAGQPFLYFYLRKKGSKRAHCYTFHNEELMKDYCKEYGYVRVKRLFKCDEQE